MSTEQNKQVAYKFLELMDARNYDAAFELFDENAEVWVAGDPEEVRPKTGVKRTAFNRLDEGQERFLGQVFRDAGQPDLEESVDARVVAPRQRVAGSRLALGPAFEELEIARGRRHSPKRF